MIRIYQGHFLYLEASIVSNAPSVQGIYYCGFVNQNNQLIPLYIGRAKGQGVTIRSRLLDHKRNENWSDVTHFGFITCSTDQEAIDLEVSEIARWQPEYNQVGK